MITSYLTLDKIQKLENHIIKNGCYDEQENSRIYQKWFKTAPRYLFRTVDKKYKITQKIICDVGCSYGMNLIHCTKDSYGIEIEEYSRTFGSSIGLQIYQRDIIKDDLSDLSKVEAIWCSAVLEHVESPHIFLRKLNLLLQNNGLLFVYVPTIPLFTRLRYLPKFGKYFDGHLAADHINAFVPKTLQFMCERAGFHTLEVSPFYPIDFINKIPIISELIDGCVYVGKKINDWNYADKATRKIAFNNNGFLYKKESDS